MKELLAIQQELHAPKNQHNRFGNYNYRSCEDILLAVKPLLEKHECILLLSDTIKELSVPYVLHTSKTDREGQEQMDYNGTRVYVEATATLINKDGVQVSVTASAREEPVKKGMDAAQITGAASSYARKYALNGLLCIDDNRDPDATNTSTGTKQTKRSASATQTTTSMVAPATPTPPEEKPTIADDAFAKALLACKSREDCVMFYSTYALSEVQKTKFQEYVIKHYPKNGTPTAP